MSIKTRSKYYYEDLELPFNPESDPEFSWSSEDGKTQIHAFLVQDSDCEDPFDGDEGEFYQFDSSYIHHAPRPELDDFRKIIRANPGRVFTTSWAGDCHGPGTTRVYVNDGPFSVNDTKEKKQGDYLERCLDCAGGYYIVPEDATDPAKYAAGVLESYSSWCNGEVYGVAVWVWIDGEFQEDSRDSECWGFIGYDYAKEELEAVFNSTVKEPTK